MKIEFRRCTPQDVDLAVPLIFSSGPTGFSYVFTNDHTSAKAFLTYAFQHKGGEFSYDNHYGLLVDGKLVGIGAIFSGMRAKGFTKADFLNILRFYKFHSLPVLIRGIKTEQIIKLPSADEICIAHLAISENYRSRGLGGKLISHLINESQANSDKRYVLDVSEENPKARSLYERLGFSVTKHELSTLKNNFGHVANHFRMTFTPPLAND